MNFYIAGLVRSFNVPEGIVNPRLEIWEQVGEEWNRQCFPNLFAEELLLGTLVLWDTLESGGMLWESLYSEQWEISEREDFIQEIRSRMESHGMIEGLGDRRLS